jgi:hypothetical protein
MNFIIKTELDKQAAIAHIRDMELAYPMRVEVKRYYKKRTLNQNDLYFSWIEILANEFGNTKEEMHDALKIKIMGAATANLAGEIIHLPPNSRHLETKAFSEYMDKVYALALEYGIILPQPNEKAYEKET